MTHSKLREPTFKVFLSLGRHCSTLLLSFREILNLKIYALVGNIKNDLVKYFMQHIRNGLFIDLINT